MSERASSSSETVVPDKPSLGESCQQPGNDPLTSLASRRSTLDADLQAREMAVKRVRARLEALTKPEDPQYWNTEGSEGNKLAVETKCSQISESLQSLQQGDQSVQSDIGNFTQESLRRVSADEAARKGRRC